MTVCTLLRMEKQCILILISTDSFNFFQLLSKKYKHDSAKATSLQLQATKKYIQPEYGPLVNMLSFFKVHSLPFK